MSNFEKTITFNKTFGVPVFDKVQHEIFDTNPKLVSLRLSLIEEEVKELKEAIKEKDMVETVDALSDILYVVYGMGASLGIDLNKAFDLVHKSNMSKSCSTEQEAKDTVEWYKDQYEKKQQPYDTPSYRKNGEYWVVFNKSTGKILKSINYQPVKFNSIL